MDLCTGLALRDLAEHYNKCHFNMIVFDEPTESLRSPLSEAAQDLLFSTAKPSTFIIAPNSLGIDYDKVLEARKENGVSSLRTIYG